jgi:hypothetical protein
MASLQYEVNRLAQDELVYESAVRGLTEVGTVEQMQKTLRNLLRMERGPNPLRLPPLAYLPKTKHRGNSFSWVARLWSFAYRHGRCRLVKTAELGFTSPTKRR